MNYINKYYLLKTKFKIKTEQPLFDVPNLYYRVPTNISRVSHLITLISSCKVQIYGSRKRAKLSDR